MDGTDEFIYKPKGLFRLIADLTSVQKYDTPCNCKERTKELHSCPFAEEIYDDFSLSCNCCASCERECADDI